MKRYAIVDDFHPCMNPLPWTGRCFTHIHRPEDFARMMTEDELNEELEKARATVAHPEHVHAVEIP